MHKNKKLATKKTTSLAKFDNWKDYYKVFSAPAIPVYQAQGVKNKTEKKYFINICKLPQKSLKTFLNAVLAKYYDEKDIISDDGFLFVPGSIPFAVTAHMDTVHHELIKDFYDYKNEKDEHILSSPQGIGGDDRCGIFMIIKLLEAGFRPTVIFCEDEEIGCVGSGKFTNHEDLVKKLSECNYIIELDRKGSTDAVFYDCDNEEFANYIITTTGYREEWGSCSDISYLAPAAGIAAVNLSCGYYNPHQKTEYVNYSEMMKTVEVVKKLLRDKEVKQFEYVDAYAFGSRYGSYGSGYGALSGRNWDSYEDDDYDYWSDYCSSRNKKTTKTESKKIHYHVYAQFKDAATNRIIDTQTDGITLAEAVLNLFFTQSDKCLENLDYFEIMNEHYEAEDLYNLDADIVNTLCAFGAECGNVGAYPTRTNTPYEYC